MRISDWSSDVCSSDLFERIANGHLALNRIEVKMQSPGHAIVHHKGLSIRPVAQGLQDLRYVGTRLRSQAQDVSKRSEEHTSELQSLMRNSYAVFCLKKQKTTTIMHTQDRNPKSNT